jgi:hypothetical protein
MTILATFSMIPVTSATGSGVYPRTADGRTQILGEVCDPEVIRAILAAIEARSKGELKSEASHGEGE